MSEHSQHPGMAATAWQSTATTATVARWAPAADRLGEVQRIDAELDRLQGAVCLLAERAGPVLRDSEPSEVMVDLVPSSPIERVRYRLSDLVGQLERLTERIDA